MSVQAGDQGRRAHRRDKARTYHLIAGCPPRSTEHDARHGALYDGVIRALWKGESEIQGASKARGALFRYIFRRFEGTGQGVVLREGRREVLWRCGGAFPERIVIGQDRYGGWDGWDVLLIPSPRARCALHSKRDVLIPISSVYPDIPLEVKTARWAHRFVSARRLAAALMFVIYWVGALLALVNSGWAPAPAASTYETSKCGGRAWRLRSVFVRTMTT
ncbi:hypothetical protein HYPSUDRAFT_60153 [Hypholoma sublateritium FD-334 SS-4]|uniref:Uncharacterized protein n=1 Tax=Hypholoma sublateritium (strain FD-334 SS-4) TaxID=945553 RepID=A0A0D2NWN0_HYPSF|nr:hypothetical protein HYPSUDRAFT_60153 [Hypholoma sublateritium FD-334 SS-4]